MTDYISRESVLQILSGKNAAWDAYQKVQSLPAADVVPMDFHERCLQIEIQKRMALEKADVRPVVLCRDCQYFENDCGWCEYFDIGMNVNDFCSQGKREEN